MNNHSVEVSIIVPIKDEADTIGRLSEEIDKVMQARSWLWECIWVDDGSVDQSLPILENLAKKNHHHRYLSFEHNAGQSAALWAGIKASRGLFVTTLDGDAQNDPADIPLLVNILRENKVGVSPWK